MTCSHEPSRQLSRSILLIRNATVCFARGLAKLARLGFCLAALYVFAEIVQAQTNAAVIETNAPSEAPLNVAFSGRMFVDINENDAGAAVRVWAQLLGKDHAIPVNPAVQILRGTNAIAQAIRKGNVDILTLTTDEYWAVRKEISAGTFLYGKRGESLAEQYILLVHRDSGISGVGDLKGRSLIIFNDPRASLARPWMETLVATQNSSTNKKFFGKITESSKLTRALLPVFFRQSDACLVTKKGFDTAIELNPQVGQQLKVIAASPEFVPTVCYLRSSNPSAYMSKLRTEIGELDATAAGRQFMTLFQCDAMIEGPESAMQSAVTLLEQRSRLAKASATNRE